MSAVTSTRGSSPVTTGRFQVARAIKLIAGLVAGIIFVGIVLVVLEANPGNDIVNAVLDAARWLVGPFKGLFSLDGREATIAVNWGIAGIVYLAVGMVLARLIAR